MLLLTVLYLFYNNFDFLSPGILFCLGFDIAVVNGITQYRNWSYELHWVTVFLIGASALMFVLVCQLIHILVLRVRSNRASVDGAISVTSSCGHLNKIVVPFWVYLIVLIVQVLTIIAVLRFIYQATSAEINGYSITQMIGQYDYMSKFSNFDKPIRGLLGLFYTSTCASGYLWGYILINNWLAIRRIELGALINFLPSAVLPFAVGGRAGTIQLILALVIMYFLFLRKLPLAERRKRRSVAILVCIGIAGIGIVLFKPILVLLGRSTDQSNLYQYLSIYIGAPIKNLDIYLTQNIGSERKASFWGETTFSAISQSISRWTGQEVQTHYDITQPFQTINNIELGNVYTCLYSLVWDFGLIGAVVFVGIMAVAAQLVYEWLKVSSMHFFRDPVNLVMIIYSYMSYGIVFAFLSNRFFSSIVSSVFIRQLALWIFACFIIRCFNPKSSDTLKIFHIKQ